MYDRLADTLLGAGVRPFAGFQQPADMAARFWYGSVFAKAHHDFAKLLLTQFKKDPETWVLEVGSFIGNSAVTWAQQAKRLGMRPGRKKKRKNKNMQKRAGLPEGQDLFV